MIQVKIFREAIKQGLEDSINKWLTCQNSSVTIKDIKFISDQSLRFNAMVIYEVNKQ